MRPQKYNILTDPVIYAIKDNGLKLIDNSARYFRASLERHSRSFEGNLARKRSMLERCHLM